MRTISLILRKKPAFNFYNGNSFLHYIKTVDPDRIFLTVSDPERANDGLSVIAPVLDDEDLRSRVLDVSVHIRTVQELESKFRESIAKDPTLMAKMKMIDMFTDTVYSYLGGGWNDFETLNSHDTRSIFKARYLLISSVLPEYMSGHFIPLLDSINSKIADFNPTDNDAIVSDIEWSFWFRDNVRTARK